MSIELKIKSNHLGAESRIIKSEEAKLKKRARKARARQQHDKAKKLLRQLNNISEHRKGVVRRECRATNLARAYMAGKPYSSIEQSRKQEKEYEFLSRCLPRVIAMVTKYSRKFNKESGKWGPSSEEAKKAIMDWIAK